MSRFKLPPSLPESWAVVNLGKLAEIKYGNALTGENRIEGDVPVYGSGGVVGRHNESISDQATIIIGRKGSVGSVFLTEGPFWCIDTAFYLAQVNEQINLDFLARYLQSINLTQLTIAVGVPGLNRTDLSLVPAPLPMLSEQQRIVAILQQIERLQSIKTQELEISNALTVALFEETFGIAGATEKWLFESFGKHVTYNAN